MNKLNQPSKFKAKKKKKKIKTNFLNHHFLVYLKLTLKPGPNKFLNTIFDVEKRFFFNSLNYLSVKI